MPKFNSFRNDPSPSGTQKEIVKYLGDLINRGVEYSVKVKLIGLKESSWVGLISEITKKGDFIVLTALDEDHSTNYIVNVNLIEQVTVRIEEEDTNNRKVTIRVLNDELKVYLSEIYWKERDQLVKG